MCYVSLFQLSEDPFDQAHAHPLRLVRGGSSVTRGRGVVHRTAAWLKLEGTSGGHLVELPVPKQGHLEQAAQDCVRCHLIQYGPSFSPCFNREGFLYLLRKS